MPGQYGMGRKATRTIELLLPSFKMDEHGNPTEEHNVCKVRIPDPQTLIGAGVLDDFDALTRLTQLKISEIENSDKPRAVAAAAAAQEIAASKDDLMKGLALIDKVVEYIVVEPKVLRPVLRDPFGKPILDEKGSEIPLPDEQRQDDILYTDEIDLEDRMFVLAYATDGSKDLESFRAGTQAIVASMENGEGSAMSPLGLGGGR